MLIPPSYEITLFNPPEADKPARGGQGLISPRLINSPLLAALQCLCRYPAALRRYNAFVDTLLLCGGVVHRDENRS